jgi:hypothetical protein
VLFAELGGQLVNNLMAGLGKRRLKSGEPRVLKVRINPRIQRVIAVLKLKLLEAPARLIEFVQQISGFRDTEGGLWRQLGRCILLREELPELSPGLVVPP